MKTLHALALFIISAAAAAAQTNIFPASGNVGIGTTSPGQKLSVSGHISVLGGNALMLWDSANADCAYLLNPGTNAASQGIKYYTSGSNGHLFQTYSGSIINALQITPSGNVGIGTTSINNPAGFSRMLQIQATGSPVFSIRSTANTAQQFDFGVGDPSGTGNNDFAIYDTTAGVWRMTIKQSSGNVGIGTTTPGANLDVKNPTSGDSTIRLTRGAAQDYGLKLTAVQGNGDVYIDSIGDHTNPVMHFRMRSLGSPVDALDITSSGNVGIGTTNPTEKLSVNGKIRAKEIIVETAGWSDSVFAKDYKLASLSEVEQHIAQNGHLPGVPSATEVAANGVSVGDMQAVLLAKIEELTLHQIAQEKELSALRTEVKQLRQAQ